jgi:hypothetical protein
MFAWGAFTDVVAYFLLQDALLIALGIWAVAVIFLPRIRTTVRPSGHQRSRSQEPASTSRSRVL